MQVWNRKIHMQPQFHLENVGDFFQQGKIDELKGWL